MSGTPPIYTIGYEKRSINDVLWLLRQRGVTRVVDVRLNPWSRRPEFCKERLSTSLNDAGIAYQHMGGLGNPPDIRSIYQRGDSEAGHGRFREHLANGASAAVDDLALVVAREPVALLCLELDAHRCHRSVVASVTAERLAGERAVYHL
jgi:uncharacterized protein (DUF488 family)